MLKDALRVVRELKKLSLNQLIEVSALYYDKKVGTIHQKHVDLRFDTMPKALDIPKLSS